MISYLMRKIEHQVACNKYHLGDFIILPSAAEVEIRTISRTVSNVIVLIYALILFLKEINVYFH